MVKFVTFVIRMSLKATKKLLVQPCVSGYTDNFLFHMRGEGSKPPVSKEQNSGSNRDTIGLAAS